MQNHSKSSGGLSGEQKIIAIHQPNYFPWLGYFYKIWVCDFFVFHDNVEHSKKYPIRRTRIQSKFEKENSIWLSVPLKKSSDYTLIKNLDITTESIWQSFHLRRIEQAYRASPYFDLYFPILKNWFSESQKYTRLSTLNIYFIEQICHLLNIPLASQKSSEIPVGGKGSGYNLALVKHLNGTAYISGMGGRNYLGINEFESENIKIIFSGFGNWLKQEGYMQAQSGPYLHGLSILDALFNIGAESIVKLLEKFRPAGV